MKTITGTLSFTLRGPLLIGGYSNATGGLDAVTARRRDGTPILPASAVRGVLREAVYRLDHTPGQAAPGFDKRACLPWSPCRGEGRCVACALFGASGVDRPGLRDSDEEVAHDQGWMAEGLRFADAAPQERSASHIRHNVSVDRWTGAKVDGRLFRREFVTPTGDALTFTAPVRGRVPAEAWQFLEKAAALADGIGNSQSRGVGAVEVLVRREKHKKNQALVLRERRYARAEALVSVEPLEPLHLGGLPDGGNYQPTERFVPGSTLLGALIAAARRAGVDDARELLGPALSFSDLLPTTRENTFPLPTPRTALYCPSCNHRADYLLASFAARRLAARGLSSSPPPTCPVCRHNSDRAPVLKPLGGGLPEVALNTRVVTRLARDPHTRSAAAGLLHLREQLEPRQADGRPFWFQGTLSGITDPIAKQLRKLASSGEPIYIGAMRSRGLGQVKVTFSKLPQALGSAKPLRDFQRRAGAALGALPLGVVPSELVPVMVRTPLLLDDPSQAPAAISRALFGEPAEAVGCWQRLSVRSGWDDQRGKPLPLCPVVAPGSVYLFSPPKQPTDEMLRAVTVSGIPSGPLSLGLGRLHIGSTPLSLFTGA